MPTTALFILDAMTGEVKEVVIEDSKEQVAKYISEEVLNKCFFKNRGKFRYYWEEKWYQRWESSAWVIKFGLLPTKPLIIKNFFQL